MIHYLHCDNARSIGLSSSPFLSLIFCPLSIQLSYTRLSLFIDRNVTAGGQRQSGHRARPPSARNVTLGV